MKIVMNQFDLIFQDEKQGYSRLFSWIEPSSEWGRWTLGVAMMTCSLFMGARMGVFQEHIYQKYGKYPKEALYYTVS
jgi:hypothetical protein